MFLNYKASGPLKIMAGNFDKGEFNEAIDDHNCNHGHLTCGNDGDNGTGKRTKQFAGSPCTSTAWRATTF